MDATEPVITTKLDSMNAAVPQQLPSQALAAPVPSSKPILASPSPAVVKAKAVDLPRSDS